MDKQKLAYCVYLACYALGVCGITIVMIVAIHNG